MHVCGHKSFILALFGRVTVTLVILASTALVLFLVPDFTVVLAGIARILTLDVAVILRLFLTVTRTLLGILLPLAAAAAAAGLAAVSISSKGVHFGLRPPLDLARRRWHWEEGQE